MVRHGLLLLGLIGLVGCSASTALYRQGLRALAAGDYDRAAQALSSVLVETPQHVGALTALGITYYHQGTFDAASEALTRALALDPSDPGIHLYLGLSALKQGQLDQVRPYLAAFLERVRSRALQEQVVRLIAVLEDVTPSAAVVDYLAYSLEAAFQQHQQVQALRAEVGALGAHRLYSRDRHHHHGGLRHR